MFSFLPRCGLPQETVSAELIWVSLVYIFCRKAAYFVGFHGKFMQALNDVLKGCFFANSSCEIKKAMGNTTSGEKEASEKLT